MYVCSADTKAYTIAFSDGDTTPELGITKVEYFAAFALQGALANPSSGIEDDPKIAAKRAIDTAKATLELLQKEEA